MSTLSILISVVSVYVVLVTVIESSQRFLYDRVVPGLWWRAILAAIPLGLLIVAFPFDLDKLFTQSPHWLIIQAGLWFLVIWVAFDYQAAHAAGLAPMLYFSVAWVVSYAAESISRGS